MFIVPAIIEGITTRKDKTVRLSIGTQELNPAQAAEVFGMNQQYCYLAVKKEPFTKNEEETINALQTDLDTLKTPSQRLRGILYRNWEQDGQGYADFATYYQAQMDKICAHFKSKLDG